MPDTRTDDETARLYEDVFAARTERIPLIVNVPGPEGAALEELWEGPAAAVAKQARSAAPKAEAGTDWLPTVNVGLYQCVTIPGLFGAEIVHTEGSEPVCRPCFASIDQALGAGVPPVEGEYVERMMWTVQEALEALPDGWCLSFPAAASPFDLAQLMLGAEFLVGILGEPEKTARFLMNLAEAFVKVNETVLAEVLPRTGRYVTNRGIPFPGFRVPADAIVNFPPDAILTTALPVLEYLSERMGPLCLHFCTEPAPSGHVLPALLESDAVVAVDNWQGMDVFLGEEAPARMQSRIAVIGDAGPLATDEDIDAFLAREAVRDVPRSGGRGLAVSTGAESVEEARDLYARWRERTG